MTESILQTVLQFYHENRWEEALKVNKNSDNLEASKVLWVWPSLMNLRFLKKKCLEFQMEGFVSLGCGCGLLEWFIHNATGLPVMGYEINEAWWKSKYSCPQFIPLNFSPEIPDSSMLNSKCALLFCYFNNRPAFLDYVKCYKGNMVIIIGPGEGSGRHTDPEPFKPGFDSPEWILNDYQEVKDTKDYVAVYVRKQANRMLGWVFKI
ncbi:unnamed protein product [Brassicogethes aeneus]|uniref:Uncharacterized protein n=1 Tax=Brassicogethes aeneus TaxID=1431903 RepID=A0A9P0AWF8_BRAAE|nr:unnamed protein product [Brassicogethes aeneus]